jgi:hypothetical protein
MSQRQLISLAAVAVLGIVSVSAEAFAARGAARGGAVAHRGAVGVRGGAVGVRGGAVGYRGGAVGYRGGAVGYRGGAVGYRGGYYRPGIGVATGAVVGGAIAASQYGYGGYGNDYPGYYSTGYTSGGQDASYCAQRYRSYDPASGTYLGNDGRRHSCP